MPVLREFLNSFNTCGEFLYCYTAKVRMNKLNLFLIKFWKLLKNYFLISSYLQLLGIYIKFKNLKILMA